MASRRGRMVCIKIGSLFYRFSASPIIRFPKLEKQEIRLRSPNICRPTEPHNTPMNPSVYDKKTKPSPQRFHPRRTTFTRTLNGELKIENWESIPIDLFSWLGSLRFCAILRSSRRLLLLSIHFHSRHHQQWHPFHALDWRNELHKIFRNRPQWW